MRLLLTLFIIIIGLIAFTGQGSMVDWRAIRSVAIHSDDWGLCGFLPESIILDDAQIELLNPGNFPPVYWTSTLEDSTDVAELASVLAKYLDRDSNPAVFQANYITSSLQSTPSGWMEYDIPDLHPAYQRPGMWDAVNSAIEAGVWVPELHGSWHYNPLQMKSSVDGNSQLEKLNNAGVLLFPECMSAFELGLEADRKVVEDNLERSIDNFTDYFGMMPSSVIAPDYVWYRDDENLWKSVGLRAVQAKRGQRRPNQNKYTGHVMKMFERGIRRISEKKLCYIERNCRLESLQHKDHDATIFSCYDEVLTSWNRGQPAVVETHRINFVSTDSVLQNIGLSSLDKLLSKLEAQDVIWLCDDEIAQLSRTGTSSRIFGDQVICRNYTHSRRLVIVENNGHKKCIYVPAREVVRIKLN